MNLRISADTTTLFWRLSGEVLKIEPWGLDSVRVRATNLGDFPDIPGALDAAPAAAPATISIGEDKGTLINSKLRAEIWANGTLHFSNSQTGAVLLEEPRPIFNKPPARWYRPQQGSNLSKIEVAFRSTSGERVFGLGQHQHGLLDNKGAVIDLE